MYFNSLLLSAGGALVGTLVGFSIDTARCRHHASSDPEWRADYGFGPCFLETNVGTQVGLSLGSVAGATVAASHGARQRGCSKREARARALTGAVLGAVPAVLASGFGGPNDYPAPRTAAIISAPLLSGVGAAWLASRCAPAAGGPRQDVR